MSAISSVASLGVTYPVTSSSQSSGSQNIFNAFEQLSSALQSNNLQAAQ
jgi:hypothetical protein